MDLPDEYWTAVRDRRNLSSKLIAGIIVVVAVLGLVSWAANLRFRGIGWAGWTGIGPYTPPTPNTERGKTLWDLLELLIVPLVLALGALWFESRQGKTERETAREKRYDATLEAYFDRMTALLLEEELRNSEVDDEVRKIARTRTLAVLRRLDGKRKADVVQFLHEADLIQVDSPIVDLLQADLLGVDMREANLREADLREANLRRASLSGARLCMTDLREADLTEAELTGVFVVHLRPGHRKSKHFGDADFEGAKLKGATVLARDVEALKSTGADVSGVKIMEAPDQD